MRRGMPPGRLLVRAGATSLILLGSVWPAGPVLAAPGLTVTPSIGLPGATLTATATGFPAGGVATFWWDNLSLLGTKTAGVGGSATQVFKIPAGATLGSHFVRACAGSFCPDGSPQARADDGVTVGTVPTPRPTSRVTPRPTARPTPRTTPAPTRQPTISPEPSIVPTIAPSPVGPPIGSFPIGAATPPPTPLPVVVVTPAPQPPDGEAAPVQPFPNIRVRDIEVTQGIQNLANDMPLVEGRRTYARVYLDVQGAATWPHTLGALEGRRGGQQIGWIWPENGPITIEDDGGERTNLDHSLQFRLPASWLSGTVTLNVFAFSYTIDTPFIKEPVSADNFGTEIVRFDEGLPLTIHLAPLHIHRSYHATDIERIYGSDIGGDLLLPGTNAGATARILSGLYRYLPISTVSVDALNLPVPPLGHAGGHEFDLGGVCKTSLLEPALPNHLQIADWTVLMEDLPDPLPGPTDSIVPDRPTIQVMDRIFTIDYFYAQADGSGSLWGSEEGFGPAPPAGAPAYAYPCLLVVDALGEPNEMLALYRVFYDWDDERELFVGMVDSSMQAAFGGGIATNGTDSVTIRMTDSSSASWPWWHSGAETVGHEVAHQAGLGHVPCADDDLDLQPDELEGGALDLTHPMTLTFPECFLSELDDRGYYGFDTYWDRFGLDEPSVISNDPAAPAPYRAYPFMGYEFPGWVDPFHYCRMLTYYGITCSATALDLPWNPPNPEPDGSEPFAFATPAPPEPLLPGVDAAMVLLSEAPDGGWTVRILARNATPTADQLQRIAAEKALPADEARPWLSVLGPDGQPTWEVTLPAPDLPHGATGGSNVFAMIVPLPRDAAGITVRGWDYTSKAKIDGHGAPPPVPTLAVEIGGTADVARDDEVLVIFSSGDPAGDEPDLTLLYAPDRRHWQVVGAGISGGRLAVPVIDLPSGADPAFRLVAFDGWSSSETTLGVPELRMPRNPPTVVILAESTRRYPLGALVRLEASAFDLEDRAIPAASIDWSSSIDGALGTGSELANRDLSAGRHVITAAARDSDGLTGSATYTLEVDASVVQPRPRVETEAGVAAIFSRRAAGQDPAPPPASPAATDHPDFLWLPLTIGSVLVVMLLLVVGARSLRVGQRSATAAGHGQKDQTLTIEHDASPDAGDGSVAVKGSKMKEK